MKAARLHAYGKPLSIDDVPRPKPGPGQVVIRVLGSGFCHSDIHILDGELQVLSRMPMTLGHENAGVVAEVGKGVVAVKEGDPVAVYGGWGCGRCDYCVAGDEQLCEAPEWAGIMHDGGYAESLLVPHERYLVKLSRLSPRDAAPLTDAALTPYRAVKKALPSLQPDHPVLVIGVGGLGQYGLKLVRLLSGCAVIAVDVSPAKLAAAKQLGAAHAIDGKDPTAAEQIRALTGDHGVCAAFDFVGADSTLALAAGATKSGGLVMHVGLAGGAARLKPLETTRFEVRYESPLWGNIKELREVIALAEEGRLTPIPVEYAPLERIQTVYQRVKKGEVAGRVVITPG